MSTSNSDDLYVRLFHGRENAHDEMSDWGFQGPVIGPVGVSWTYSNIKLNAPGFDDFEFLPEEEGLISYGGKFYGDFEVLSASDPRLADMIRESGEPAHGYEKFCYVCYMLKANKPKSTTARAGNR